MKLFITILTIFYCFTFVANAGCWEDPTECTDDSLCREATLPTYNSEGLRLWASLEAPDHVKEALSRELTCGAEPYVESQTDTDETHIQVVEPLMSQEKYNSLTDGAKAIIEEDRKDCKEEHDGILTVLNHAVTKLRVGRNDEYKQTLATVEVLDYGGLHCDTAISRWCGSGGCRHEILVNGVEMSAGLIQGIEEVQLENGEYILVGGLHGSSCDTAGYNYCYVALRWDGERFLWKKP